MKRLIVPVALIALALLAPVAVAQPPLPQGGKFKILPIHKHYHVKYRCPHWKEKSFHNHGAAHAFEEKLESYGFKVKFVHHGGHYHVKYWLPCWKEKKVFNHSQAHNLENWFESLGCQANVVHH